MLDVIKPRDPLRPASVKHREVIFDLETNGLLAQVSKVHLNIIRVIDDGEHTLLRAFREHELQESFDLMNTADVLVSHNGVGYDLPVLEKLYPDFVLAEGVIIRDCLPMARMCFANIKDKDFRLFEKGLLEGKLIGTHTLAAYGQRMGNPKGDYKDVREAKAAELGITDPDGIREFVWGAWNEDMEAYGLQDIEVTTDLWMMIKDLNWSDEATRLEHRIHHIMFLQEQFGFNFDIEGGQRLARLLHESHDVLHKETVEHFGTWVRPKKMSKVGPRPQYGEDDSRTTWAEVTEVKKTIRYKDPLRPDRIEGSLYCEVQLQEFNPNSRPQIIDRLTKIYEWVPVELTEKGNPEVNDDVLRTLARHVPICESLAELFFLNKLLGQLESGKNAWLGIVGPDGKIHGYVNTGGTISRRASHLSPNMAQVPKVQSASVLDKATGEINSKLLDKLTGKPIADCFKADGTLHKGIVLKGRLGKFGYECRSLFSGPPCEVCDGTGRRPAFECESVSPNDSPEMVAANERVCTECSGTGRWHMMGCDLSGIELRCLGARLAEFDGGDYLKIILEGDPHTTNMVAFQINSRDTAKTCLYAIMYGGGDEKVGSIVCPTGTSVGSMKARGKQLKANLQSGIPAFGALIRNIGRQARKGNLLSLDGGKLYVRSAHAALNLQLQSDAAIIAKLWVIFFFDMMEEAGFVWGKDWGLMAWVHDEVQAACRTRAIAEAAAVICKDAARLAGEHFNYAAPIAAESKIGLNWQMTH